MAPKPRTNETNELPSIDWTMVPFDVGCARCGHDLRGLTEPKCPACELMFRWEDAVPIEKLTCTHCDYHIFGLTTQRCPECGQEFAWEEVLDDYRLLQKPFFEYRWRQRPVRSLIKSWWLALRPGKFWRLAEMQDPARLRPLFAIVAILLVITCVVMVFCDAMELLLWDWRYAAQRFRGTGFGKPYAWYDPLNIFQSLISAWTPEIKNITASITIWVVCNLAALLVFQQSMKRHKVRTSHIVRVWVYAVPQALPPTVGFVASSSWLAPLFGWDFYPTVESWTIWFFFALVTRSIHIAYKHYLRMPHSWAIAVSVQLMALFGAASVCELIWGPSYVGSILLRLLEFLKF